MNMKDSLSNSYEDIKKRIDIIKENCKDDNWGEDGYKAFNTDFYNRIDPILKNVNFSFVDSFGVFPTFHGGFLIEYLGEDNFEWVLRFEPDQKPYIESYTEFIIFDKQYDYDIVFLEEIKINDVNEYKIESWFNKLKDFTGKKSIKEKIMEIEDKKVFETINKIIKDSESLGR